MTNCFRRRPCRRRPIGRHPIDWTRFSIPILSLAPADRRHTTLVEQALAITSSIYAERWLLWENPGSTVPPQFLFVLIFWLFLIFVSFGLFAPANPTVIASFLLVLARGRRRHPHDSRHGRSDASRLGSGLRRADAPRGNRGRPSVRMPFAGGPIGQAAGRTTLDCDTIVAIHRRKRPADQSIRTSDHAHPAIKPVGGCFVVGEVS